MRLSFRSVLKPWQNLGHKTLVPPHANEDAFSCFSLLDGVLIGIPALFLYPVFRLARLPFKLDFVDIAGSFWVGTASVAIFCCVIFLLIAFPAQQTLIPMIRRYWSQKRFIVIAAVLAIAMICLLGPAFGTLITVDALFVAELQERFRGELKTRFIGLLVAALYMFCGLILVFAYNHALAGITNPERFDSLFHQVDRIAFHIDVSAVAHMCRALLPGWWIALLEFTYFTMYVRLAGTLVFMALCCGRREAVRLVRTTLICYAIALFIYAIFPAKGPYASCPLHHIPGQTRSTQEGLTQAARALWAHDPDSVEASISDRDYFISFPSLHIALPLIPLWALRRYRRLCGPYLLLYLTLTVPAVIVLEWHYLIDVFGGIAVAILAIWLEHMHSSRVRIPASFAFFLQETRVEVEAEGQE